MLRPAVRSLARRQFGPRSTSRFKASLASEGDLELNPSAVQKLTAGPTIPKGEQMPKSLQALYLRPLRREAQHGVPTCDLQIRSYSLQPLDFFCDFALRAAYYLGLPAYGPVPLPRITERWTVPRDHFIFKKSQENFERVTMRRLIQIKDGNREAQEVWLAYLRKHMYVGLGMKANVYEFGAVGGSEHMQFSDELVKELDEQFAHLAQSRNIGSVEMVDELLSSRKAKEMAGLREPPSTESPVKKHLRVARDAKKG